MKRSIAYLSSILIFIILSTFIAIPSYSVQANESRTEGNYVDVTFYCGHGVCVPFGTNHKATSIVYYYYVAGNFRIVYRQTVSGSLTPKSSIAVYIWLFNSPATYTHANGTTTIGGWYRTGASCGSGSTCDGFASGNGYYLNCNGTGCTGRFRTASYFTTRCIPTSIGHTLTDGF
jgi:hypothetical protein